MRTMSTEKLLKTVPIIQNQMDALLDFNVSLAMCRTDAICLMCKKRNAVKCAKVQGLELASVFFLCVCVSCRA